MLYISNEMKFNCKYNYFPNLLEYELRTLYSCIAIESKEITLNDNVSMNTTIGFLADTIESRNSNLLIALINESFDSNAAGKITNVQNEKKVMNTISLNITKECLNITIIVTPNCYLTKWWTLIDNLESYSKSENKMLIIDTKTKLQQINLSNLSNTQCLIIPSSIYDSFYDTHQDMYTFKRVIYYKLERLPKLKFLKSNFKWFISCYINSNSVNKFFKGDVNLLIKTIFKDLDNDVLKKIILETDPKYILNDVDKITINIHEIKCNTLASIYTLNGLVDNVVMNCLNSEDSKKALSMLGENNILTEQNIIKYMSSNIHSKIKTIETQIDIINKLKDNSFDKSHRIKCLNDKLEEQQNKLQMLQERIRSQQICFICYEKMEIKTVLKCCSNAYCFECMSKWLHSNTENTIKCPMCKTMIDINSHLITNENNIMECRNLYEISSENTKLENLQIFLKFFDISKKLVIVCNYDNIIQTIFNIIQDINIIPVILKGTNISINNIIDKFLSTHNSIILSKVNPNNYLFKIKYITDIIFFHSIDDDIQTNILNELRINNNCNIDVWCFKHDNEFN